MDWSDKKCMKIDTHGFWFGRIVKLRRSTMNYTSEIQPNGPRDPVDDPEVPDTPHPDSPEIEPNRSEPYPYPMKDPIPGSDPDTEPVREPEPTPSFPEPIPGGPPDVFI